ncbi:hypothetical protein [Microbacterium sp. YY-01]|uniref:hypothetical protein n=1 Tax=Microbacterium sp. YY-01 TaxID=3421634 RepID=UPI003D16BA97
MKTTHPLTDVRRWGVAVAIAAIALPLSGCLSLMIPSEPTELPTSHPSTEDPFDDSDDLDDDSDALDTSDGGTLSFAEGADLDSTDFVEWGDGFMMDSDWEVSKPDDGDGGWEYKQVNGDCTAGFWQGMLGDVGTQDDRDATAEVLALILDATAAEVVDYTEVGKFSYQIPDSPGVDHLNIYGETDTGNWLIAARAFATPNSALYIDINCATSSAVDVAEEVFSKNPIVVW